MAPNAADLYPVVSHVFDAKSPRARNHAVLIYLRPRDGKHLPKFSKDQD